MWVGDKRGMWVGDKRGMWVGDKRGMWVGDKRGMWVKYAYCKRKPVVCHFPPKLSAAISSRAPCSEFAV